MLRLNETSGAPTLVATEWDRGIQRKEQHERADFKERWSRFRDQDPPKLLQSLADSIAWESDVFREVFGDVPVVWLEDGRNPLPSDRPLGRNRRVDFEIALVPPDPRQCPVEEVLPRIHEYWIRDAESTQKQLARDGRDPTRDKEWAKILKAHLTDNGWALVIVGAVHASQWDNQTLYNLLRHHGHDCETQFLVWTPTIPQGK
jgi:hypothetical protein